jgi:hypothetical protein
MCGQLAMSFPPAGVVGFRVKGKELELAIHIQNFLASKN